MARPLGHIRILISARLLLDLEEADRIFQKDGPEEYADYMRCRGKYEKDFKQDFNGRELAKGPLWDFARAALALNKPGQEPVADIGVLGKDTGETALPILRNLDAHGLSEGTNNIALIMTAGGKLDTSDLEAFGADLLLSQNAEDVQMAVDNGVAAAVINFPPEGTTYHRKPGKALRIYTDGDGVAVGASSEVVYLREGIEKYFENEDKNFDKPIEPGPFTALLAKISALNATFPEEEQPFKIALLTARSLKAASRMDLSTEKYGIVFNERLNYLSDADKGPFLNAHDPDLFIDDVKKNVAAGEPWCPSGQVPYPAGSDMDVYLKKNAEDITKKKEAAAPKVAPKPRTPRPKGRH